MAQPTRWVGRGQGGLADEVRHLTDSSNKTWRLSQSHAQLQLLNKEPIQLAHLGRGTGLGARGGGSQVWAEGGSSPNPARRNRNRCPNRRGRSGLSQVGVRGMGGSVALLWGGITFSTQGCPGCQNSLDCVAEAGDSGSHQEHTGVQSKACCRSNTAAWEVLAPSASHPAQPALHHLAEPGRKILRAAAWI